jgi:hypothetical protein
MERHFRRGTQVLELEIYLAKSPENERGHMRLLGLVERA